MIRNSHSSQIRDEIELEQRKQNCQQRYRNQHETIDSVEGVFAEKQFVETV